MNHKINAVRVGSSHNTERLAELKTNHESEELKSLLTRGFTVENIKVKHKRPRFHKEPTPKRIKVQAGFITITVEYADWVANGSVGRIIERY